MFRSVLAAIKPVIGQAFVGEFAAALANQCQLAVDAYSVIDEARLAPAESVPLGGGAFKVERDTRVLASARQHAVEALTRAESAAKGRGVPFFSRVLDGDVVTTLSSTVQRCDLLICGHTRGSDASDRSLLQAILKHCPRPAIVVPQARFPVTHEVLIAFDASPQAARALASFAGSGLADGCAVHVVSFHDDLEVAATHADIGVSFLDRHGIPADARTAALAKDAGSHLLQEVERLSADLLVMGAFGTGAVREFFVGSVTRSILNVLPIPVFLDH